MPVNEKILFGSFQYIFSLITIIYCSAVDPDPDLVGSETFSRV
jgi:hypothetical protein